MDINSLFPSRFLKASDLHNRSITAVIKDVNVEEFDDGKKLVVTLKDNQQLVILNKTNAMALANAYGTETDNWPGHTIQITTTHTTYRGQTTRGLKIYPLGSAKDPKPESVGPPMREAGTEVDADIPW